MSRPYPLVHCTACGEDELLAFNDDAQRAFLSAKLCSRCFHAEQVRRRVDRAQALYAAGGWPDLLVVRSGEHIISYKVASELPYWTGLLRGYGGSKFVVQLDDGRRMTSSNMWSGRKLSDEERAEPRYAPMGTVLPLNSMDSFVEHKRLVALGCFYQDPPTTVEPDICGGLYNLD